MSKDLPLRIEGYWYSSSDVKTAAFRKPEPRQFPWKHQEVFLQNLKKVQAQSHCMHYRGWSSCRICGKSLGSGEYDKKGLVYLWYWPEGLIHYIIEHNVKPSKDFRNFIISLGAEFV